MPLPFHRHLFRNGHALRRYRTGDWSRTESEYMETLRADLRLQERLDDVRRPDHFLDAAWTYLIPPHEGDSLAGLISGIIGRLEGHSLETGTGALLAVDRTRFAAWQDLITDVPALVLVASGLRRALAERPMRTGDDGLAATVRQIHDRISGQVSHTALPAANEPRLDTLLRQAGMIDLHVHLNGSTQPEHVFLDGMARPGDFAAALLNAGPKEKARSQLDQEERGLNHAELVERLLLARQLRRFLAAEALRAAPTFSDATLTRRLEMLANLLAADSAAREWPESVGDEVAGGPLWSHARLPADVGTPLSRECVLLIRMLDHLPAADPVYAHAFHAYLLLWCQFHRLTVQQLDQYGFDQFQRHSDNELRSHVERTYESRFESIRAAAPAHAASAVEGRFAPRVDRGSLGGLLVRILRGSQGASPLTPLTHLSELAAEVAQGLATGAAIQLRLVCHFIKAPDKDSRDPVAACRHASLRRQLRSQLATLIQLVYDYPVLRGVLVGFDAAANELEAGPEVFAPTFRALRRFGYPNFTYHVGEDFVHLASGIRAVLEAVEFLDLRAGNRLGHATAVGIRPELWADRLGEFVYMTTESRLFDLVVARRHLLEVGRTLSALDDEIGRLSSSVFGVPHAPDTLYRAWRLFHHDPLDLGAMRRTEDDRDGTNGQTALETARLADTRAFDVYEDYHSPEVRRRGKKVIQVPALAADGRGLDAQALTSLQEHVLEIIRQRGLVLETMLTSNLRISMYRHYREHHVFRWLGLEGQTPVHVVLGTDDPGIFTTHLRNEYAHLLRELDARCPGGPIEADRHIERLLRDAQRFAFQSTSTTRLQ